MQGESVHLEGHLILEKKRISTYIYQRDVPFGAFLISFISTLVEVLEKPLTSRGPLQRDQNPFLNHVYFGMLKSSTLSSVICSCLHRPLGCIEL